MYHFGDQRPSNGYDNHQVQQFNFHPSYQLPSYPQYPTQTNRYRDTRDSYERRDYDRRDYDRRDRDRDRPLYQRRIRMASDRPLLHTRRESTPDQFDGMQDSNDDIPKYRNVDNMSDSDSEVMEESESEQEGDVMDTKPKVVEEPAAPKWSNPEPYTSLPPPEASKKRKDVVKLIRKARIAAAKDAGASEQVAQNDDFISFGFEDEERRAPENAPSGPKADRESSNLHGYGAVQQPSMNNGESTAENGISLPVPNNIARKLASHKRKRSVDDVGDQNGHLIIPKRLRSAKATQPNGEVLPEWVVVHPEPSTPWVGQHQRTENAGFRLHKEICDFYDFVKPCDFEETMRLDLLNRIRKAVKKIYPDCEVHAFGSFAAGLYLPDADLDLVIVSQDFALRGISNFQTANSLFRLSDLLVREDLATKESLEIITKAKVPLVKFKENLTGIRVDVSFENLTGPRANITFKQWKSDYPAMPILVTVIKQFLMMRGLNEVVNGGIGGFSVTCLVTALLQNMPRVQSGELIPEHHLGEVLLEFLDLYGNQFDLYGTAIDLNPPRFVDKADVTNKPLGNRENRLHIVDPNDRSNDISGGSKNVSFIFKMFSYARIETLRAMRNNDPTSLLDWMLGGNYSIYTNQREYLRRLYNAGRWTSVNINNEEQLLNDLVQQTRNFKWVTDETTIQPTRKNSSPTEEEKATISDEGTKTSTTTLTSVTTLGGSLMSEINQARLQALKADTRNQHLIEANKARLQVLRADKPNQPVQPVQPVQRVQPVQPVKPVKPVQPQSQQKPLKRTQPSKAMPQDNVLWTSRQLDDDSPLNTIMRSAIEVMNRTLLAFEFTTAERVQAQFPERIRSTIIKVVRTPDEKNGKPVFIILFDTLDSASKALSSRKGDAHMFHRYQQDITCLVLKANNNKQVSRGGAQATNAPKIRAEWNSEGHLQGKQSVRLKREAPG